MLYWKGDSMNSLPEGIKGCNTMRELDELRIEVVRDMDNFIENQKLFIKKLNSLKRNGKTRFNEGYTLEDVTREQKKNGLY